MSTALLSYASEDDSRGKRLLIRTIEQLTGARRIQRIYDTLATVPTDQLWRVALERLEIELQLTGTALEELPPDVPLVLLGNHPFGVLDGIILCHLTAQVRPRFRVLTNSVLCVDDRVEKHLLPIDFAETRSAMRTNVATKRAAVEALADGEAVALFPAGGVATAPSVFSRRAEDLQWKSFVAKLVRGAEATVVPLYFHGQNGRLFQWVSQFSLTLRLSLLLHELASKRGEQIAVTVGRPMPWEELSQVGNRLALTEHLRRSVEELGEG